jgi:hypothetical protein
MDSGLGAAGERNLVRGLLIAPRPNPWCLRRRSARCDLGGVARRLNPRPVVGPILTWLLRSACAGVSRGGMPAPRYAAWKGWTTHRRAVSTYSLRWVMRPHSPFPPAIMRALRTRGVGPLPVALIAACRTTPREACEPARGTEVWVERHYPSAGVDTRPRPGRLPTSAARQIRGPCPCDRLHRDRPGRDRRVWGAGPRQRADAAPRVLFAGRHCVGPLRTWPQPNVRWNCRSDRHQVVRLVTFEYGQHYVSPSRTRAWCTSPAR